MLHLSRRIFETDTGANTTLDSKFHIPDAHRGLIYDLTWSSDDTELLTASADSMVQCFFYPLTMILHQAEFASALRRLGSGMGCCGMEEPSVDAIRASVLCVRRKFPSREQRTTNRCDRRIRHPAPTLGS
eukprot:COSAG01_NODE_734_length_13974_cov_57.831784_17_plen_130_part_00